MYERSLLESLNQHEIELSLLKQVKEMKVVIFPPLLLVPLHHSFINISFFTLDVGINL